VYVSDKESGSTLKVKVIPRSERAAVAGERADRLVVKLTSPPVEGEANKELVKVLAKKLKIAGSAITIVRGHSSREKVLFLSGLDAAEIRSRLDL
jgi:uncharacterized protein